MVLSDRAKRARVGLMKAGDVRRVVGVERILTAELSQQLRPLDGIGIAQAQQAMFGSQLGEQRQRAFVEAAGRRAEFRQELGWAERQLEALHDGLGELRFVADAGLEAVHQTRPERLYLFATPTAAPFAGARE